VGESIAEKTHFPLDDKVPVKSTQKTNYNPSQDCFDNEMVLKYLKHFYL
jgi:hypothetical protein